MRIVAFKFKAALPITVDGGLTIWEISRISYGKESDVQARCLTTGEVIRFVSARSRFVDGVTEGIEFLAWEGTTIRRIVRKLVKDGKAEIVSNQ